MVGMTTDVLKLIIIIQWNVIIPSPGLQASTGAHKLQHILSSGMIVSSGWKDNAFLGLKV
jgi:hypothetical protein